MRTPCGPQYFEYYGHEISGSQPLDCYARVVMGGKRSNEEGPTLHRANVQITAEAEMIRRVQQYRKPMEG